MNPTREQILSILKGIMPELKHSYGVEQLYVFGSVARGDHHESSDVDLLARFSQPIGWDILAVEQILQKHLPLPVQLFDERGLAYVQPSIFSRIKSELVEVVYA